MDTIVSDSLTVIHSTAQDIFNYASGHWTRLRKNNTTGLPNFKFESQGKLKAKGKGEIEMYFVSRALKQ